MTEPKDIADYYIDQYRKSIGFANKALAIALLILIVNWLFSIEPGYQVIIESRQTYKNQLKQTEKQLAYFVQEYSRYYNSNTNDSETYINNLRLEDALQKQISGFDKTNGPSIENSYLRDSLDQVESAIYQYKQDSSDRKQITLLKDSILHVKQKRIELEQAKTATINDNLKDYDWKSLIRFIFIVAGNPRDGSLYLMGLITLILIFALIVKRISLHYLAKGLRIYKSDSSLGINSYQDFSVPTPFWLSPLPVSLKGKKTEGNQEYITRNDLANVLGFNNTRKLIVLTIFILLVLLLLQLRFLYICIHANTPIHFDFSFSIGIILCSLSIAQATFLIYPSVIDDHYNFEQSSNNRSRRVIIVYGILALTSVVMLRSKNSISKFYGLNAKRFIKKRSKNIEKSDIVNGEGLYYRKPNKKDPKQRKIVYFFDTNNHSVALKQVVNAEQLEVFKKKLVGIREPNFSAKTGYRFNQNQYSWHTEHYTLFLIKSNKQTKAVEFIFEQVLLNHFEAFSSYRILDLAVKIFIRLDTANTYFKKFKDYYDGILSNSGTFLHLHLRLQGRLNKWKNEKWIDKVKNKKVVVYNGIKF